MGAAKLKKAALKEIPREHAAALSELRKTHAELLAVQRNMNELALRHRDLGSEQERLLRRFGEAKDGLEKQSGMSYNENTLGLEKRKA